MSEPDDGTFEGLAILDENILVGAIASSNEDIIRKLGSLLQGHGLVKDTFVQAVLDREKEFPTGLQTNILGVAIPHTDTDHVNRSALAIATLDQPVVFQAMGDPASSVTVQVVIMLAISNPKAVVHVLRSVISILEDTEALEGLSGACTPPEVRKIVHTHMQRMAGSLGQERST